MSTMGISTAQIEYFTDLKKQEEKKQEQYQEKLKLLGIVCCKDCKYYNTLNCKTLMYSTIINKYYTQFGENDFCSFGVN